MCCKNYIIRTIWNCWTCYTCIAWFGSASRFIKRKLTQTRLHVYRITCSTISNILHHNIINLFNIAVNVFVCKWYRFCLILSFSRMLGQFRWCVIFLNFISVFFILIHISWHRFLVQFMLVNSVLTMQYYYFFLRYTLVNNRN